jgi:hypothetical protein
MEKDKSQILIKKQNQQRLRDQAQTKTRFQPPEKYKVNNFFNPWG